MAILGYDTKGSNNQGVSVAGMKRCSKFTLASAATLTELHGWFNGSGGNMILYCYSDVAGVPTTRLAYTSPLALTGSDVNLGQTGFAVALAAGDYWIGAVSSAAAGGYFREGSGGTHAAIDSVTFNPPANPFEGGYSTGSQKYSFWAVVSAAAAPVADFTATPLTGAHPLSVAFTDTSTGTPTSWAWTFGDSGTSTSQNPTHSYTAAGTYTVALTATNAGGSDSETKTGYVTVGAATLAVHIYTSSGWVELT